MKTRRGIHVIMCLRCVMREEVIPIFNASNRNNLRLRMEPIERLIKDKSLYFLFRGTLSNLVPHRHNHSSGP